MKVQIDYKKLKAAIAEINAYRRGGAPKPPPFDYPAWNEPTSEDKERRKEAWGEFWKADRDFYCSTGRATKLYMLRSHLRGKLHIQKQYVPTHKMDGSHVLVERDLEWQTKQVAKFMEEFTLPKSESQPLPAGDAPHSEEAV